MTVTAPKLKSLDRLLSLVMVITGNILQVLHDGTDGIATSRDEDSFGIGSESA